MASDWPRWGARACAIRECEKEWARMKRRTIAQVLAPGSYGGLESVVALLTRGLTERGHVFSRWIVEILG